MTSVALNNTQARLQHVKDRLALTTKVKKPVRKQRRLDSVAAAAYGGAFLLIISLVSIGYQPDQATGSYANALQAQSAVTNDFGKPLVDQAMATMVAADLAQQAELPIANNVASLSASLALQSEIAISDSGAINNSSANSGTLTDRSAREYTVVTGDDVGNVAQKFNLSKETIKWANNLTGDVLEPGRKIVIPPVNGVIYTVKQGDSIDSIASSYKADKERLIAYNDLEIDGLSPGKKIIIPDGNLPDNQRPGYRAPVAAPRRVNIPASSSFTPIGGGQAVGRTWTIKYGTSMLPGNNYAFGNCTAYVYDRRAEIGRPIGPSWGNATSWPSSAQRNGFQWGYTPAAGSILQNGGGYAGYGHVAVVESINPDGSITVTEMNAWFPGGGFNIVSGRVISAEEANSGYYKYIY